MAVERVRDDVVHRDEYGQIRLIRLVVFGKPVQQGSKKSLGPGRPWIEDNKEELEPWRNAIASASRNAGVPMMTGPLNVVLTFYFKHRDQDVGTGRNAGVVKPNAPLYKKTRPDLDKLARAVLDALTEGGIWEDDARVAVLTCEKRYAPIPGVRIEIRPLGGADGQEPTQGAQGHGGVQGGQAPLWVEDGAEGH